MIGNDIDNVPPPRILVVYDGVLAREEGSTGRGWRKRSRYVINPAVAGELWRLWHATSVRVEAVVFGNDTGREQAAEHLEREYLPIAVVRWWDDRQALVRELPTMHGVIALYDKPEYVLMYGGLGQTFDQIGRLA